MIAVTRSPIYCRCAPRNTPRQRSSWTDKRVRQTAHWDGRGGKRAPGLGRHRRAAVPIERPQADVTDGAAGRAAHPQEPITGRDGRADRPCEQHRHLLGLAFVTGGHQLLGILEDLAIGRPAYSRCLLGLLPAGIIHFALVKPNGRASMSARRIGLKGSGLPTGSAPRVHK
jgi:hypothetical protein